MSDLELKRKESLTKAEVAKRLSAFAKALAAGGDVELEMGDTSMSLRVPDDVRVEFEVEVDGDEIEVEIEMKWSTGSAAEPRRARSRGERRRRKEHGGAREQQAEPTRLSPDRGSGEDCRHLSRDGRPDVGVVSSRGSGEQALACGFALLEGLFDPHAAPRRRRGGRRCRG